MSKRSYLTSDESLHFGKFIVSDFRRGHLQKQCREKQELGMKDCLPWTLALRMVTKEDLKLFRKLYSEGVRDFNDVIPIIQILQNK